MKNEDRLNHALNHITRLTNAIHLVYPNEEARQKAMNDALKVELPKTAWCATCGNLHPLDVALCPYYVRGKDV